MKLRTVRHISLSLAFAYLSLVSVAAFCEPNQNSLQLQSSHHSKTHASHSPLCAWACKIFSQTDSVGKFPSIPATIHTMVLGLLVFFFGILPQTILEFTPARGPPL